MKKYNIIFFFYSIISFSQYANVEISSGGFSFVPAFIDKNPNLNFNLGTNSNKLFSAHLIGSLRLKNSSPRTLSFITRFKAIDKKFKLSIGTLFPDVWISEDYIMQTYWGQEVIMSYPISESYRISSLYIHGKGRNNDLEINLFVLNNKFIINKTFFLFQLYYLDKDNLYGFAKTIEIRLKKKITIKGFLNYTIPLKELIPTIGLKFEL